MLSQSRHPIHQTRGAPHFFSLFLLSFLHCCCCCHSFKWISLWLLLTVHMWCNSIGPHGIEPTHPNSKSSKGETKGKQETQLGKDISPHRQKKWEKRNRSCQNSFSSSQTKQNKTTKTGAIGASNRLREIKRQLLVCCWGLSPSLLCSRYNNSFISHGKETTIPGSFVMSFAVKQVK